MGSCLWISMLCRKWRTAKINVKNSLKDKLHQKETRYSLVSVSKENDYQRLQVGES